MATVQPRTRPRPNTVSSVDKSRTPSMMPTHATASNAPNVSGNAKPSPLSIFVTNLKLMDLDLLPDWPGITTHFFSGTGAQGQKKRVQCVEWALVKLLSIWDPDETASKLEPLFPPLNQMQSTHLRAALLRCLEAAKKNGALGRDAVVRKTMLDECRGERLEELLAQFSTTVLTKVAERDGSKIGSYPPVAVQLALRQRAECDSDDIHSKTLILAHKVSLRHYLDQKKSARVKYHDLALRLGALEKAYHRRIEVVRAKEAGSVRETLSDSARVEVRRLVRENWSGSENWMETLLQGEAQARGTGLLDVPFDKIWRRVQQGRLSEIDNESPGLLEQLEGRVRRQKDRVARWDAFQKDTFGPLPETSASSMKTPSMLRPSKKGIDFGFRAHADLQYGASVQKPSLKLSREPRLNHADAQLVDGLRHELTVIKGTNFNLAEFVETLNAGTEYSEGALDYAAGVVVPELRKHGDGLSEPPIRTNRSRLEQLRRRPTESQAIDYEMNARPVQTKSSTLPPRQHEEVKLLQRQSLQPLSDKLFDEKRTSLSPTQEMADEIMEMMDQASPSPLKQANKKPVLSLAQRTRLSMARQPSSLFNDEPDLDVARTMHNEHATTSPREADITTATADSLSSSNVNVKDAGSMDLAARTRSSMAGIEEAQKRTQLQKRKSARLSRLPARKEVGYCPKVEEGGDQDHADVTTQLIMEEDVEAVFRSRPKMRNSPLGSPSGIWDEMVETADEECYD